MWIVNIVIVAIVFILLLIFLIRTKIIFLMSLALRIAFFALIITLLSALFFESPFRFLADLSLRGIGTYESIQKIDEEFFASSVSESAEDIWNDVESFFTGEENVEEVETKGFLEERLYPTLVTALTLLFRFLTVIFSLAGLIGIVYLSYATLGASDTEFLKREVAALQHRMIQLENRLNMSSP